MRDRIKIGTGISMLFLLACSVSYGQDPYGTTLSGGPGVNSSVSPSMNLPTPDGIFHYSLSASQLIQFGYYGSGTAYTTSLSGNVGYVSKSTKLPSTILYSGGVLFTTQAGQGTSTFQNLAISQGLVNGPWAFYITDSVSYLPQSPTTGLSGIPGIGDLGSLPIDGPSQGPAGGVLSNFGTRVSNMLSGTAERRITGKTSISGSGNWTLLRFVDGYSGVDNTQVSGDVALNHRFDARDSGSLSATYSNFTYDSLGYAFHTRGLSASFQRVLSRTLSASVSAGPTWIDSSNSALIPSRLTFGGGVGLSYTRRFTSAAINYNRGVNGGSGVQPGAISDSVQGSVGRTYGRDWAASVSGNYIHTSGLANNVASSPLFPLGGGASSTVYGGLQVTRKLGRSFSGFLSYTAQRQSVDNTLASQNAFQGLSQTIGIGISFSPRSTRLGQF